MKYALCISIVLLFSVQNLFGQHQFNDFFKKADDFFSTYVVESKIDYQAIQKDSSTLFNLIQQIETADLGKVDRLTQTAFLINAYNLNVIAEIVKRLPTAETIYQQDFFVKTELTIASEQITLNQIQHERLPFISETPLYHFALMQADFNFPMMSNFAYTPDKLNEQLKTQTAKVINYGDFLRVRGRNVIVPKLLKWYKKDFVETRINILKFINMYRTVAFNYKDTKVKFSKPKRWSLNSYVETTKIGIEELADKKHFKKQFKLYNPTALLKPGSTELRLSSPDFTNFRNSVSIYGDPFLNVQAKYGIGQSTNIGFISNLFSNLWNNFQPTIGPKVWFRPIKKTDNLIFESSFIFPAISTYNTWWGDRLNLVGVSLYTKATYYKLIKNKFLINFNTGLSIENIKKREDRNNDINNITVGLFTIPFNYSIQYYPISRLSFLASVSYNPYFTWFRKTGQIRQIKGNYRFLLMGIRYQFSHQFDVSISYCLKRDQSKYYQEALHHRLEGWFENRTEKGRAFNFGFGFSF